MHCGLISLGKVMLVIMSRETPLNSDLYYIRSQPKEEAKKPPDGSSSDDESGGGVGGGDKERMQADSPFSREAFEKGMAA